MSKLPLILTMISCFCAGLYLGMHWYTVVVGFCIGIVGGYADNCYKAGKWL
jgi:hypothetical protein